MPLKGIRVLDFSQFLAGPLCGALLADLGAEVIKIERPATGDPYRGSGPPFADGMGAPFIAVNYGKRSICLDLEDENSQDAVAALVRGADIVIVSFRPASLRKLNLEYDALRRHRPDLIYCAISAYDDNGPMAETGGLDLIVQAASGLMSVTGDSDGTPMRSGVPITDYGTALVAALNTIAALRNRDLTGNGCKVNASLFGTAALFGSVALVHAQLAGEDQPRSGNAHPHIAPYQLVRTQDGYLAISAATPSSWSALCAALDLRHLEDDDLFASNALRIAHRQELIAVLEEKFTTRPTAAWADILDRAGVPCGPVNNYTTLLNEPNWLSHMPTNQFEVDGRDILVPHMPAFWNGAPVRVDSKSVAPHLGADTEAVLAGFGLDGDEPVPGDETVPGGR
ncbi:MAG: CaiB/BaiF CoA transferase family protein [Mycolicibacterium sp.]|uniref:CaiB/BaiF CoA transferase family protein n=1 Tax=Mycolicibacterium sp. TaxID=2320850 RepID=UPI003D10EDB2